MMVVARPARAPRGSWGRSLVRGAQLAVGLVLAFGSGCSGEDSPSPDNQGDDEGDGNRKGLSVDGGADYQDEQGSGACAELEEAADLIPANLLFVVDKSGSMECNAPPVDTVCEEPVKVDTDELSKWQITQGALTGPQGALRTLAGQVGISAGLIAFPTDSECAVPVEGALSVPIELLDEEHLAALATGLDVAPEGKTPLAGAAIRGLEALRLGIHAGELGGNNYLVLMTDGEETCQEAALGDLKTFVEQARVHYGIRTFAIGAPGSENSRALLSELAILGGTRKSDDCKATPGSADQACHIDLTTSTDFETDLGREFTGITAEAAGTCEYDVPASALVDPTKVNVEYTSGDAEPIVVPRDPRPDGAALCAGADGWQYGKGGGQIVLCGPICERVQKDPQGKVRVVFGCRETVVR